MFKNSTFRDNNKRERKRGRDKLPTVTFSWHLQSLAYDGSPGPVTGPFIKMSSAVVSPAPLAAN